MSVADLDKLFSRLDEYWAPKIVARINDMEVKIARLEGDFDWHSHPETDELFLVHKGHVTIHYRGHSVDLAAGDIHVVPKGAEHKPEAKSPCEVVLLEPKGTRNTGDVETTHSREADDWT
jgi:mannose-6-phosphate isomerase-like protein (cupin superfamily)